MRKSVRLASNPLPLCASDINTNNQGLYLSWLQKCVNTKSLAGGRQAHATIIKLGCYPGITLVNALVNMYFKCGGILDACQLFDRILERDIVTWTTMITGYVRTGDANEAIQIFKEIKEAAMRPNKVTYVTMLSACTSAGTLAWGKHCHAYIVQIEYVSDTTLGNTLIDMYAKCDCIDDAFQVFSRLYERDKVSWNAIITGYAQLGHTNEAIRLFIEMGQQGFEPDPITFSSTLIACGNGESPEWSKCIHAYLIKTGLQANVFVASTLVSLYAKFCAIEQASQVFDRMPIRNVVSWNTIIAAYVQQEECNNALKLFDNIQKHGLKPTEVTFVSLLSGCSSEKNLEQGKLTHGCLLKVGLELNVVKNALIDMYVKCCSVEDARKVFDRMPVRNVISWTTIISGYAEYGDGYEALWLFEEMQNYRLTPDKLTFVAALSACANLGALDSGKHIHNGILKIGLDADVFVGSAAIAMYAKCGSIKEAAETFNKIYKHNMVSWTAMISGYAEHGDGIHALKLFAQMQSHGFKADRITFNSVLTACSHVGLLNEGLHYFISISHVQLFQPSTDHYACVVDLLGRAGQLHEAKDLVDSVPFNSSAIIWTTFLSACRMHDNIGLGESAHEFLFSYQVATHGASKLRMSHHNALADVSKCF